MTRTTIFTAAMAASRLDVRALALVNAMIPLPGETPGQWWEATGQPEAQNQARGVNDPADDFTHDLSPEVLSALEAHPHAQAGAVRVGEEVGGLRLGEEADRQAARDGQRHRTDARQGDDPSGSVGEAHHRRP